MNDEAAASGSALLYAEVIDQEYQRQFTRRDKLEAKGQHLIGHSGLMVTLATGLVALVAKNPATALKAPTVIFFALSLASGLIAMGIGIHISGNRTYHVLGPQTLDQMAARAQWQDTEVDALYNISHIKRIATGENRKRNDTLARWATIGQYSQIALVAAFIVGFIFLVRDLS